MVADYRKIVVSAEVAATAQNIIAALQTDLPSGDIRSIERVGSQVIWNYGSASDPSGIASSVSDTIAANGGAVISNTSIVAAVSAVRISSDV